MDGSAFDRLARSVIVPGTRRRALAGIVTIPFVLHQSDAERTDARKKKR
jgi:hypothetical protein